ncbi:hypothetical protein CF8_0147 [Aeromonas phage CF8]|nr:hypothetical protein CF8_0147 [Aeromonas phage CF8]
MRYKNKAVSKAKNVLVTRMGYIVNLLCVRGESVKGISDRTGASYFGLLALKNKQPEKISFDHLLVLADKLGLDYSLTMKTVNGEHFVSLDLPGYIEMEKSMGLHRPNKANGVQLTHH